MPFIEQNGRLTWVADSPKTSRSPRQLIELAARQLADTVTDSDYICVSVASAAGPAAPPDVVCFRLEGESWVFDKMG